MAGALWRTTIQTVANALCRREMTVMALYGIVLVSAPIMGPRPGPAMIAVTCALGLAIGALWVRPWDPTPHWRR